MANNRTKNLPGAVGVGDGGGIIRLDDVTNTQGRTIPDATPKNSGVMTAAQAAKLASITPGGGGGLTVPNIAGLRAAPIPVPPGSLSTVSVTGWHTEGDGGGGVFNWVPTSTAPDDGGGEVIKPNALSQAQPGRWLRVFATGSVNIRWYGAIGDGASHPLSAFFATLAAAQAVYPSATSLTNQLDWVAVNAAVFDVDNIGNPQGAQGVVVVPPGTYLMNDRISISRPIIFQGESGGLGGLSVLKFITPGPGITIDNFQTSIDGGDSGDSAIVQNVVLKGTQPAVWATGVVYAVGDFVMNVEHRAAFTQLVYKCVAAGGVPSTVEPLWPQRGELSTILTAPLAMADVAATVLSTQHWPVMGTLLIDDEQIQYTANNPDIPGTAFINLVRGANGTVAADHADGAPLRQVHAEESFATNNSSLGQFTENFFFTDADGNQWQCLSAPGLWVRRTCVATSVYVQSFPGDAFYLLGTVAPGVSVLTAPLGAADVTANVDTTINMPTSGILLAGAEQIKYAGITPTSFTGLVRGFNGTTPAAHVMGSTVSPFRFSAATGTSVQDCQAELNAGRAIYLEGTDSSVCKIRSLIGQANDSGGIFDQADIGSTFDTCLMEQNGIYFWGPNSPASTWADFPAHPKANGLGYAPGGPSNNGFFYRPQGGVGVTGAVEPVWPTVIGGTVVDGTLTWECIGRYTTGQPYMNRNGGITASLFVGCYAEPDQVPSALYAPGSILGENIAEFSLDTNALLILNGANSNGLSFKSQPNVTPALRSGLGNDHTTVPSGFFFERSSLVETWRLVLVASELYWQFEHASADQPLWFSNIGAPEGPGQVVFNQGIFIGNPFGYARHAFVMAAGLDQGLQPGAAFGQVGDLWWNMQPKFGWPDGWRCIADAPAAVWDPFFLDKAPFVSPQNAVVGAPFDITTVKPFGNTVRTIFTNLGTMTQVGLLLPVVVGNQKYRFANETVGGAGIRIFAQAGQKIRIGNQLSSAGGYIESVGADVGAFVQLEDWGQGATEWIATDVVGTWTAA